MKNLQPIYNNALRDQFSPKADPEKIKLEKFILDAVFHHLNVVSRVKMSDQRYRSSNVAKDDNLMVTEPITSVVMAIPRKGLKEEQKIKAQFSQQLSAEIVLGKATDKGDCFFDSLAQILNRINATTVNTDKYLRMLCHQFYLKNKVLVDSWNQKEYGGIDKGKEEYYFIQYTSEECDKQFNGRPPIWGRAYVEGIILCRELKLEGICVIEALENPETQRPILSFHLVTAENYKGIDEGTARELMRNSKIPILVVEQNSLHFVPLLTHSPVPVAGFAAHLNERSQVWNQQVSPPNPVWREITKEAATSATSGKRITREANEPEVAPIRPDPASELKEDKDQAQKRQNRGPGSGI